MATCARDWACYLLAGATQAISAALLRLVAVKNHVRATRSPAPGTPACYRAVAVRGYHPHSGNGPTGFDRGRMGRMGGVAGGLRPRLEATDSHRDHLAPSRAASARLLRARHTAERLAPEAVGLRGDEAAGADAAGDLRFHECEMRAFTKTRPGARQSSEAAADRPYVLVVFIVALLLLIGPGRHFATIAQSAYGCFRATSRRRYLGSAKGRHDVSQASCQTTRGRFSKPASRNLRVS